MTTHRIIENSLATWAYLAVSQMVTMEYSSLTI